MMFLRAEGQRGGFVLLTIWRSSPAAVTPIVGTNCRRSESFWPHIGGLNTIFPPLPSQASELCGLLTSKHGHKGACLSYRDARARVGSGWVCVGGEGGGCKGSLYVWPL